VRTQAEYGNGPRLGGFSDSRSQGKVGDGFLLSDPRSDTGAPREKPKTYRCNVGEGTRKLAR